MAARDHSSNYLDHDESEDTVSLCDLPLYGCHDHHTDCSTATFEDTMKDDESFEFFTQEWLENNQDSNFFPNKDTIFGGSSILSKKPISRNTQEFKKHDHDHSEFDKLISMNKGKKNQGGKHKSKRVFPASGSMKSRWYYYGFGVAGVPTEMDLSSIKSRQNRHRKSYSGGGGMAESGGFLQGKGWGRLIRDLSCDGLTEANSMVKASLVYIPRV